MRRKNSDAGEKFSFGNLKMPTTANAVLDQMRGFVIRAGGAREHHDSKSSWLHRAARALGISHGRAASYYYRKAKTVPAHEYLAAKAEIEALEAANQKRWETIANVESMDRACAMEREADRLAAASRDAVRGKAGVTSVVPQSRPPQE